MATMYENDADGSKFIPATQRPDGTWRKPRRVKDGYIPQEEVPLYESKGKQFKARQNNDLPVGLTPEIVAQAQKMKKSNNSFQPIPGLILNVDKKKKKKKKSETEEVADRLAQCDLKTSQIAVNTQVTDPAKKLKNLRKKLRDIETLEEKLKSGILTNLDKDQKEKMTKKNDIIKEIKLLESQVNDDL